MIWSMHPIQVRWRLLLLLTLKKLISADLQAESLIASLRDGASKRTKRTGERITKTIERSAKHVKVLDTPLHRQQQLQVRCFVLLCEHIFVSCRLNDLQRTLTCAKNSINGRILFSATDWCVLIISTLALLLLAQADTLHFPLSSGEKLVKPTAAETFDLSDERLMSELEKKTRQILAGERLTRKVKQLLLRHW